MSFRRLEFTKTWLDPDAFPAYEPDEGKVRADLQSLHDETKAALNRLIDALNDVSAAAELPIAPVEGLDAATVQEAVEQVFASFREVASGAIADGTVTKEKLDPAFLARIYGGRAWISLDAPTVQDDPDRDFPVGQLWLRPAVEPLDPSDGVWEVLSGSQEAELTFRADEQESIKAVYTMDRVGRAGDQLLLRLDCTASDELGELTLSINASDSIYLEEDGLYEATLDNAGSLQLMLEGAVPEGVEDAWLRVDRLCVMDASALERQYPGIKNAEEWMQMLSKAGGRIPAAVWAQTDAGRWEQIWIDTMPVRRGGTGLDRVKAGAILYGAGDELMEELCPVEQGVVQFRGGKPTAVAPEELAVQGGYLRVLSGSYVGTGSAADCSVELPVTPLMILVWPQNDAEDTACLANGGKDSGDYEFYDGKIVQYQAQVRLVGNALRFTCTRWGSKQDQMLCQHMNAAGAVYQWLAVY